MYGVVLATTCTPYSATAAPSFATVRFGDFLPDLVVRLLTQIPVLQVVPPGQLIYLPTNITLQMLEAQVRQCVGLALR